MISREHNFLFIHVPKTAGNSIQSALLEYAEDTKDIRAPHQDGTERFELKHPRFNTSKHSTLSDYRSLLPVNEFDSLFKFAVIRNPWDRAVSYYFSRHRGSHIQWDRVEFLRVLNQNVHPIYYYIRTQNNVGNGNLPDTVASVAIDTEIDLLIRFEDLPEAFDSLCRTLNLPKVALPRRNASRRNHYSEYLDDELRKIIGSQFEPEIEWGKYQF